MRTIDILFETLVKKYKLKHIGTQHDSFSFIVGARGTAILQFNHTTNQLECWDHNKSGWYYIDMNDPNSIETIKRAIKEHIN